TRNLYVGRSLQVDPRILRHEARRTRRCNFYEVDRVKTPVGLSSPPAYGISHTSLFFRESTSAHRSRTGGFAWQATIHNSGWLATTFYPWPAPQGAGTPKNVFVKQAIHRSLSRGDPSDRRLQRARCRDGSPDQSSMRHSEPTFALLLLLLLRCQDAGQLG